ncbi:NADH kinase pos5, partial [Ascosphaera atra]
MTSARYRGIIAIGTTVQHTDPTGVEADTDTDLLSLRWPSTETNQKQTPRNILLVHKQYAPKVTSALLELASHIKKRYPSANIVLEPQTAQEVHEKLPFEVYTNRVDRLQDVANHDGARCSPIPSDETLSILPEKIDLTVTLGGDGTVLRASSFFAETRHVPPFISFGMGTLGFLGEWDFKDYGKALEGVM